MPRSRRDEDDSGEYEKPKKNSRRDDDSGEHERPARSRQSGSLLWLWLLLGIGGPIVLCCGGGIAMFAWVRATADAVVRQRAQQEQRDEATAVRVALGEEARVGDVGVTVTACSEKIVDMTTTLGERATSKTAYLVINLRLKNYNPNRNATPAGQTGYATVRDDLGNLLQDVNFTDDWGNPDKIHGQISRGKMIELRSDSEGADALVVARPVPGAKRAIIRLDATRYDGSGLIIIDAPIKK